VNMNADMDAVYKRLAATYERLQSFHPRTAADIDELYKFAVAGVAQLAEHSIRNREVVGSMPIASSNIKEGTDD
jgi:hypothetical protein